MKKLSPLQIERLQYQPKLPSSLQAGVNSLELVEGSATESVRDQEQIKALFENTYGKPTVTFKSSSSSVSEVRNVGVILSGGQAPGGLPQSGNEVVLQVGKQRSGLRISA